MPDPRIDWLTSQERSNLDDWIEAFMFTLDPHINQLTRARKRASLRNALVNSINSERAIADAKMEKLRKDVQQAIDESRYSD